jgi:hypothetical protein
VTIYARDLPPNTTSNIAGAQWSPYSVFDEDHLTAEFEAQYVRASRIAHRAFQNLVGDYYGVRWLENYWIHQEPLQLSRVDQELNDLFPDTRELRPGEHPFRAAHVQRFMTMLVEPPIYLNAVLRDFLLAGGRLVVLEFHAAQEIMSLPTRSSSTARGLGPRRSSTTRN